jgi:hypothetical protein
VPYQAPGAKDLRAGEDPGRIVQIKGLQADRASGVKEDLTEQGFFPFRTNESEVAAL